MEASELLGLYSGIFKIRAVEEKLTELFNSGITNAPVHLSIGQEAVAVGVMAALKPQDKIVSNHRCHAHYLAKGGDMKKMFAEILGKQTGCCKGKGGSMHLFDDEAGHIVSISTVGAGIPIAVGIAVALKMRGDSGIAVVFLGDGAVEQGVFWESINYASVQKLPILFVCENNLYATHSHILTRQPSEIIASRVKPHGIATCRIDNANDILRVRNVAVAMSSLARKSKPAFIEACTYRIREHWGVAEDGNLGYRSREEVERWKENCPLKNIRALLVKKGLADEISEIEFGIIEEINAAVSFALNSADPDREELYTDVFAEVVE